MLTRSLTALAFSIVLGALPAWSQGPQPPPPPPPPPGVSPVMDAQTFLPLVLTDSQLNAAKTLIEEAREGLVQAEQAMREAEQLFQEAGRDPLAELQTLKPLHDQLALCQWNLLAKKRALNGALFALLSSEQRSQIEAMGLRLKNWMDLFQPPQRTPGGGPKPR